MDKVKEKIDIQFWIIYNTYIDTWLGILEMNSTQILVIIALIIGLLAAVSVYSNVNMTYEEALLKCSHYKSFSDRNMCRMNVTEKYKYSE